MACFEQWGALPNPRIGHLDFETDSITPLTFKSGTHVASLYQVVEAGAEHIAAPPGGGVAFPAAGIKMLPPLTGRDVLAVGKNYAEHAVEFDSSRYDSSDKVDQPTHPVIFTRRATSIVAHGVDIFAHPDFTQSLDYEGEIDLIVGKTGFRVSEEEAWDHVWGFTIINDVTARERQRDHKQLFIGKSADTTAPMVGPVAVSKDDLPEVLRVQTKINGELRRDATTQDLIFLIPFLIKTISEGMTIQPGNVIATGTPAAVSTTGLGTLRNKVIDSPAEKVVSSFASVNQTKDAEAVVFLHDLGGSSECWMPLISAASMEKSHSLICRVFSKDLEELFTCARISPGATIVARGFASLVALSFVSSNPGLVKKLVFISPPPLTLIEAAGAHAKARSILARYAKACCVFKNASETLEFRSADVDTAVIVGEALASAALALHTDCIPHICHVQLPNVGCWAFFENPAGLARAVKKLL
ncbi:hypothetical protein IWZ03DRAFT_397032 [Phyllosticta citriasiana]|uniref:Fumarylacetoacetase-like C-terminal domain-containing protein n=1 Tax=Phyllosticta citriasiana TaxID=595635 RepID=A0ABR1KCY4_9PEZI